MRTEKSPCASDRLGLRALPLGLLACLPVLCPGQRPPSTPSEYQLKAAFLYNFAKFVEWPAGALGDPGEPIVLGILGKDPFGPTLEETIRNKTVQGRPLVIRRGDTLQEFKYCHILFITTSERRRLPQIFSILGKGAVLTVGETEHFTQLGGIINFTVEESKIRFEISVDNAEQSGLKISSQLLRLARIVKTAPGG